MNQEHGYPFFLTCLFMSPARKAPATSHLCSWCIFRYHHRYLRISTRRVTFTI